MLKNKSIEKTLYLIIYFIIVFAIYYLLKFNITKGFASLIFGVVAMGFIMNKFDKDVRFFKGKK